MINIIWNTNYWSWNLFQIYFFAPKAHFQQWFCYHELIGPKSFQKNHIKRYHDRSRWKTLDIDAVSEAFYKFIAVHRSSSQFIGILLFFVVCHTLSHSLNITLFWRIYCQHLFIARIADLARRKANRILVQNLCK